MATLSKSPLARLIALDEGTLSLQEALGVSEADADAFLQQALIFLDAGDSRGAEAAGLIATHLDPMRAEGWRVLGAAQAKNGKCREAMTAFESALMNAPNDVQLQVDIADVALQALDYERAARALQCAVAIDPQAKTSAGARAQVLIVEVIQAHEPVG